MQPIFYTKQTADENIGEVFVKIIQKSTERVWSPEVKPMIMTEENKIDFDNATKCWICEDFIEGEKRVRDHCHFTGKFWGAAHQKCNSFCRKPKFIPIFSTIWIMTHIYL